MIKPSNRLPSNTVPICLGDTGDGRVHELAVSLVYERITPTGLDGLREIVFVTRGKIGHGMDDMLRELGIKLSRAIQDRDPETGENLGPVETNIGGPKGGRS